MYFFDDQRHKVAHIHARYQDERAVFAISDGSVLAGALSRDKRRLVQAWIEIRREQLLADWALAIRGEPLFPIEPLH